jgi:hypothetical protein
MDGLGKVIYEDIEEWFMESGSSHHMTKMRSIFLTFSESDTDCFVGSGTNTRQAIRGYGYVRFQLKLRGFMGIKHMLYVPELKVNLLSVATFEDDGYEACKPIIVNYKSERDYVKIYISTLYE